MTNKKNIIGLISEILDNRNLIFIINNNIKCNIEDLVGVRMPDGNTIIAQVHEIKIDFYSENSRQFLISKAAADNIQAVNEVSSKPRFGQSAKAKILGIYLMNEDGSYFEKKYSIGKYTPSIFQEVYPINIEKAFSVYGLVSYANVNAELYKNILTLGDLVFPVSEKILPLLFSVQDFKRHTLISGVTGSGKSRLSSLIIKELARRGAHISILDPHSEYSDILANDEKYQVFKYTTNNDYNENDNIHSEQITFSEKYITPNALAKLIPYISDQQEDLMFDLFNKLEASTFSLLKFTDLLIQEFNIEVRKNFPNALVKFREIQIEAEKESKNKADFLSKFVSKLKSLVLNTDKVSKLNVIVALLTKVTELRESGLISTSESNWLKTSPNSIDIFNIDYSTSSYVKRFIESIIQYFFRKKSEDSQRIIVIDEAHMLLNVSTQTGSLLKQLLREGRKFNISVIFISQNYNDISDDVRGQFHNQFSFRENNLDTQYFPDQVCKVVLSGSKASFAMRVKNISSANK